MILLGTFFLTVVFDLTVAVQVGLVLACVVLHLPHEHAVPGRARRRAPRHARACSVYRLFGPLFFGAVGKIEALPAQLPPLTRAVVLEMHRLITMDASGLDAFENVHRALARAGVRLVVVGLNEQPLAAMKKWGLDALIGAENLFPDRDSAFAALVDAKGPQ